MKEKDAKVLVTGGTGFIGAHIVHTMLKAGYQNIYVSKRKNSDLGLLKAVLDKIHLVEVDIEELLSLIDIIGQVDVVIHAAAMVSFAGSDKNRMLKINVEGTADLVNVALDKQIKKLIHISSVAALGRTGKAGIIDESSQWLPGKLNTNYAVSKNLAEREVWRGYHEGLSVVILNPSIVIGPGFWDKGSAKLVQQVHKGLPFYPPGRTGFVDVRDVADLAILALENEISGERFICNGINLSYKDLLQGMAKNLDVKGPTKTMPGWLRGLAWRYFAWKALISGQKPIVTRESLMTSYNSFFYDNQKSKSVFDFEYRSIEDTIAYTCQSYLASVTADRDFAFLS